MNPRLAKANLQTVGGFLFFLLFVYFYRLAHCKW